MKYNSSNSNFESTSNSVMYRNNSVSTTSLSDTNSSVVNSNHHNHREHNKNNSFENFKTNVINFFNTNKCKEDNSTCSDSDDMYFCDSTTVCSDDITRCKSTSSSSSSSSCNPCYDNLIKLCYILFKICILLYELLCKLCRNFIFIVFPKLVVQLICLLNCFYVFLFNLLENRCCEKKCKPVVQNSTYLDSTECFDNLCKKTSISKYDDCSSDSDSLLSTSSSFCVPKKCSKKKSKKCSKKCSKKKSKKCSKKYSKKHSKKHSKKYDSCDGNTTILNEIYQVLDI